jgi:anti-sigma factor RsiW
MSPACPRYQGDIAAYLLGSLDETDRGTVEGHLSECAACRAEFRELAPLPPLLSRVPAGEVLQGPARPGAAFADRVVAAGAARRKRRRTVSFAAAAVLAAGAAVGSLVGAAGGGPKTELVRAVDHQTGVRGQVELTARPAGTQFKLTVSGVPRHGWCVMLVVARNGTEETAASWQANAAGTATFQGTSPVREGGIRSIVVTTESGRRLVSFAV